MKAIKILYLFNAISILYASEGDSGSDGGGGTPDYGDLPGFGEKPCPMFRCSTGYVAIPKDRAKFISTGCEDMGGGMMIQPNQAAGREKFASCCDQWHACYQVCGSPKKLCDDAFKQCSTVVCGADEECNKSANLKGMMLNFGGCQKYDAAQRSACQCTSKNTAEGKRLDVLNYFYKNHAPDGQGKASTLVKKVDTTAKMAALMRKLIEKYPKAIKIEKSSQEEMMQRIMREAREKKKDEEEKVDDIDDSDENIEL